MKDSIMEFFILGSDKYFKSTSGKIHLGAKEEIHLDIKEKIK